MATLSLCMLIDEDEIGLAKTLTSLVDIVDEIIVVDLTGRTGDIDFVREMGGRSYCHRWQGSVAEARNRALRRATSDWVLVLDADDRIHEENAKSLRDELDSLAPLVMGLNVPVTRPGHKDYWESNREVRLVRNQDGLEFEYPVAERVNHSIRKLGGSFRDFEFPIDALEDRPPGRLPQRSRLALRILDDFHSIADLPSIDSLFTMGAAHYVLGTYAHAECYLVDCLSRKPESHPLFPTLIVILSRCYRRLGDLNRAAEVCLTGLECFPNDDDMLWQLADTRQAISKGGTWQPPR